MSTTAYFIEYGLSEASSGYGTPTQPYEINDLYVRGNYVLTWKTAGGGIFSFNMHDVKQAVFADNTPYHVITVKVNGEVVKSDTSRLYGTRDFAAHIRLPETATIELVFSGAEKCLTHISRLNSYLTSDNGLSATTTPAPELPTTEQPSDDEDWVTENGIFVSLLSHVGGCGSQQISLHSGSTRDFALVRDNSQLWFIGDKHTPAKYTAQIVLSGSTDEDVTLVDFEILDCRSSISECFDNEVVDLDIPVPEIQNLAPLACIEDNQEEVAWKVLLRSHWGNPYYVDHRWTWDTNRAFPFFSINGVDGEHWTELVKKGFNFYVHVRHRSKETGAVSPWVYVQGDNTDPEICEGLPTLPELPENPPVNPDVPQDCPPVFPPPDSPQNPDPDNPDGPQPPTDPNPDPEPCVGTGCGGGGGGDPDDPWNPPGGWPPGYPPGGCVGEGCEPGSDPPTPGDPGGGGPGGPDPDDPNNRPPTLPPTQPPTICTDGAVALDLVVQAWDVKGREWTENDSVNVRVALVTDGYNTTCDKAFGLLGLKGGTIIGTATLNAPNQQALINIGNGCPECVAYCFEYTGSESTAAFVKHIITAGTSGIDEEGEIVVDSDTLSEGVQRSTLACGDVTCADPSTLLPPVYEYTEDGVTYRFSHSVYSAVPEIMNDAFANYTKDMNDYDDVYRCVYTQTVTGDSNTEGFRKRQAVKFIRCQNGILQDVTRDFVGCELMYWGAWSKTVDGVGQRYMPYEDHLSMSYYTYDICEHGSNNFPNVRKGEHPLSYDSDPSPIGGWDFKGSFCTACCDASATNIYPRNGYQGIMTSVPPVGYSTLFNNLSCLGTDVPDPNYGGGTYTLGGDHGQDSVRSLLLPCYIPGSWKITVKDNQFGDTWVREWSLPAQETNFDNPADAYQANFYERQQSVEDTFGVLKCVPTPGCDVNFKYNHSFNTTGGGGADLEWHTITTNTRTKPNNCDGVGSQYTLRSTWPDGLFRANPEQSTESVNWITETQQWLPSPTNTCRGITAKNGTFTMTLENVTWWSAEGSNPLP